MTKINHCNVAIFIILLSLIISSCGQIQQLGPTPTTATVLTSTPTITPSASLTPTQIPKVEYVRGITLGTWYESNIFRDHLAEELTKMKNVGANTLSIAVAWFTPNVYSNEIRRMPSTWSDGQAGVTISDDDLRSFVREARKLGLNTDIIIQLRCDNYSCWTGAIQPSNFQVWDQSYIDYALYIAHIAEEEGVNRLILTDELESTQLREDFMLRLIKEVRTIFHGEVMINTTVENGGFGGYKNIPISVLQALDRLGLNTFIPATSKWDATADEMVNSLVPKLDQIADYYESIGYTNLSIGSVGAPWVDGGATSPGNPPNNTAIDYAEQALYLQAFLTALPKSKLDTYTNGAVIWDWTIDYPTIINGEGTRNNSHNIGGNLLAQQVLSDFWVKEITK